MLRLAALMLALIASPVAAQDEGLPEYYGVWAGKIGTYPVHACFTEQRSWGHGGVYYYDRTLIPIRLDNSEGDATFEEYTGKTDTTEAAWSIDLVDGDNLSGTWTPDGTRELAISLSRIAWTESNHGDPCASPEFMSPRLQGGTVTSKEVVLDGWKYHALSYSPPKHFEGVEIQSFALDETRPGDAAINRALAYYLPRGDPADGFVECNSWNLAAQGADGYFSQFVRPTLIGPRLVVFQESNDTYCGGAHPNTWWLWRVFDRYSGEEIFIADWLNANAAEPLDPEWRGVTYSAIVTDALRARLLKRWPDDKSDEDREECREAAEGQPGWTLGVAHEGMMFTPDFPRVIMACSEEIVLPWDEMAPFLSDEGRAGLALLQAD